MKALQFVAAATPPADSKDTVCTAFLLTSDGDIQETLVEDLRNLQLKADLARTHGKFFNNIGT